jgi:hypothetical protein
MSPLVYTQPPVYRMLLALSIWYSDRRVILTTHLHVPSLRMSTAIPLFPPICRIGIIQGQLYLYLTLQIF